MKCEVSPTNNVGEKSNLLISRFYDIARSQAQTGVEDMKAKSDVTLRLRLHVVLSRFCLLVFAPLRFGKGNRTFTHNYQIDNFQKYIIII